MRNYLIISLTIILANCSSTDWETVKIFNSDDPKDSLFGPYNNISYEGVQVSPNIKNPIPLNNFTNQCIHENVDKRWMLIDAYDFQKKIQTAENINSYDEAIYDWVEEDRNKVVVAAQAVSLKTNETYLIGNLKPTEVYQSYCFGQLLTNICEAQTNSTCVVTHVMDKSNSKSSIVLDTSNDDILFEHLLAKSHAQLKMQKEIENEEARTFLMLYDRCEEFGFEGDNNIRLCIEREAEFERQMAMQKLMFAQQNNNKEEEKKMGFLAQILRDVIVAYPEAKRKAEIEQRRVNNAYRRGVSDGRVQCQGSNC